MNEVRALFMAPTLTVGGAERQWATLLPLLRDRGFAATVVTLRHEGHFFDRLVEDGFDMRALAMQSRFDMRGVIGALRLGWARPDLVVTQSIDAHVLGRLVAATARIPHVTVEHAGPGFAQRSHHGLAYRAIAPRVAAVVAVSEAQVPVLRDFHYPPERIRVIPNGIDTPPVARTRADVRTELGVGDDDLLAVLVATLRPEKRADLFVAAVAEAHTGDRRVRGVVVGSGPELDRVRSLADAAGSTSVLGYREEVGDLVGAADVLCLTSEVEAMPMSILEAMALGRAVVATNVGGVSGTAVAGETAVLVPAGDPTAFAGALRALADDPARRAELGENGRRIYLDRFTADRMADSYASLLAAVATAGAR